MSTGILNFFTIAFEYLHCIIAQPGAATTAPFSRILEAAYWYLPR
jgi:hypothetical protein